MNLNFNIQGKGPVLIILHGLYGSSDNWYSVARALAGSYTVITPDLRNHGKSPHSSILSYESMALDVKELIDKGGFEKVFLAGHSMGGKVAMLFSMMWPDAVNGLTVFDISPFDFPEGKSKTFLQHQKIIETLLNVDISGSRERDVIQKEISSKIGSEKIAAFLMKSLTRSEMGGFSWKLNLEAIKDNIREIMGGIVSEDVSPVTGFPVTFVRGSESDYLPEEEFFKIEKVFPAAGLITIKGAGHWLHAEKPDEVISIIRKMSSAD